MDHPQAGEPTVTRLDRQRGMLLGLAVGDALGAAVEFKAPGSFVPVTDYRRGGPHHLEPGEWTDDTSMALALADSLAEVGWDLEDQMRRYVRWWRSGEYSSNGRCFDIGNTTVADADTTSAACGQFAGAYFGESGIPVAWNQGLRGAMTSKTSCSDFSGTNEHTE